MTNVSADRARDGERRPDALFFRRVRVTTGTDLLRLLPLLALEMMTFAARASDG